MSFFGAVRLLVAARPDRRAPVGDDVPPEIPRGVWAVWVNADPGTPPRGARFGDACRTGAGREGRLVEIIEDDRTWLVCQEI